MKANQFHRHLQKLLSEADGKEISKNIIILAATEDGEGYMTYKNGTQGIIAMMIARLLDREPSLDYLVLMERVKLVRKKEHENESV